MSAKSRSPEEWISFLLTCMDYTPAKPDWKQIAIDTGAYKSGKFVNQAYANLRKKYEPMTGSVGSTPGSVPATPRPAKKSATQPTDQEDDLDMGDCDGDEEEAETKKPKRTRKTPTPRKRKSQSMKKEESDDSDDKGANKKIGAVKVEPSEDELNGTATVDQD